MLRLNTLDVYDSRALAPTLSFSTRVFMFLAIVFASISLLAPIAFADVGADPLATEHATFENADGNRVLEITAQNVRKIFETYQPAVDSSSSIVSPKAVSGSLQMPRLQVGIRACVFIICRTVQLDSDIVIRSVAGPCERNLMLTADLHRSTALLSDNFDALNVSICLNPHEDGERRGSGSGLYDLTLIATAHHTSRYSSGPIASNSLRFLKLQTQPMLNALNQNLTENGARDLSIHP